MMYTTRGSLEDADDERAAHPEIRCVRVIHGIELLQAEAEHCVQLARAQLEHLYAPHQN